MNNELMEKNYMELGAIVRSVRDKQEAQEKNYDGLVNNEIKAMKEQIGEMAQSMQSMATVQKHNIEKSNNECSEEVKKQFLGAFTEKSRGSFEIIAEKAMTTGNASNEIVRPDFLNKIITRIFELSPILGLAENIQTTSKVVEYYLDDEDMGAGIVRAEGAAYTDTNTPDQAKRNISINNISAKPKVSLEMLRFDSILGNIDNYVINRLSNKFARQLAGQVLNGNGTSQLKGILTYAPWTTAGSYERDKLDHMQTASSGTLTVEDLKRFMLKLDSFYQSGASFTMNSATFADLILAKDSAGAYLINPILNTTTANGIQQLMGKPVYIDNNMPIVGITGGVGNKAVIYGNYQQGYLVARRGGLFMNRNEMKSDGFVHFEADMNKTI